MQRSTWRSWLVAAVVAALAGCGSDDGVSPDPELERFVGTWDATVFTVTADDPPNTEVDILDSGSFNVTIEPSGTYTARLEVFGFAQPEIGQLSVSGSTLTLTPTQPPGDPTPSTFEFRSEDYLVLDGPTEFDFNLDGTAEPAQAHIELERRTE